jgi:ABC-2 type transport system permease protein
VTGAASTPVRIASHTGFEVRTILSNGEQLLLTVLLPVAALIGLRWSPLRDDASDADLVATVLALAVISSAFTSLAIATGFERRYDVLRWFAASPLGRTGLLAAKAAAAGLVILGQVVLILAIAAALGMRVDGQWLAVAALVVMGAAAFGALGLLLGGTARAAATLALANLLWLVLALLGGVLIPLEALPDGLAELVRWLPSAALTEGLRSALSGGWAPDQIALLAGWAGVGAAGAVRWFRWT